MSFFSKSEYIVEFFEFFLGTISFNMVIFDRIRATNGTAKNFVKTFKRKMKSITRSDGVNAQTALQRFLFANRTTERMLEGYKE